MVYLFDISMSYPIGIGKKQEELPCLKPIATSPGAGSTLSRLGSFISFAKVRLCFSWGEFTMASSLWLFEIAMEIDETGALVDDL